MLMTAYACSIGGVLTPIGTPPNIIMIGFIRELAPEAPQITFFNWMVWGFIAMVLYFIVTYFVLWKMFPADVKHIDGAQEFIKQHRDGLGKWTRAQKNTLIAFIVAVVLWVLPGSYRRYGRWFASVPHADKHQEGRDDTEVERRSSRYRLGYVVALRWRSGDWWNGFLHRSLEVDWRVIDQRVGRSSF